MRIDYNQMDFIHPKLKMILQFIENETGLEFTITSIYRDGDKGVHGTIPVRGIDLRMWSESVGYAVTRLVNQAFTYDPSRPEKKCVLVHDVGHGLHLHVQAHPNTARE